MPGTYPFSPDHQEPFNAVCLIEYEPYKAQEIIPSTEGDFHAFQQLRNDLASLKIPGVKQKNIERCDSQENSVLLWWLNQKGGAALHKTLLKVLCGADMQYDLTQYGITDIKLYFLPFYRKDLPNDWKEYWSAQYGITPQSSSHSHTPVSRFPYTVPSSAPSSWGLSDNMHMWGNLPAPKPKTEEQLLGASPTNIAPPPLLKETLVSPKTSHRFHPYSRPELAERNPSGLSSSAHHRERPPSPLLPSTPPPAFGIHFESLTHCLRLLRGSTEVNVKAVVLDVEEKTRTLFQAEPEHCPNFSSDSPRTIHDAILKAIYSHGQRLSAAKKHFHLTAFKSNQDLAVAEKRSQDLQSALEKEQLECANLKLEHAEMLKAFAELQGQREKQALEVEQLEDAVQDLQENVGTLTAQFTRIRGTLESTRAAEFKNIRQELEQTRQTASQIQTELDSARQATSQSRAELERIRVERSAPFLTPALLDAFIGISDMACVASS